MGTQLTMANDDIYDNNHAEGQNVNGSVAVNTPFCSTVIDFQIERKKKEYVDAMERIAAVPDEFDW